jgi:hypothetical protein
MMMATGGSTARFAGMPYTLWSRGRLLGETDLGFVQVFEHVRFGWFMPSPLGVRLMPVLTGIPPAALKVGRMLRNSVREAMRGNEQADGYPADVRRTTAYADLMSIEDEVAAMQLRMQDPAGHVMDTDDIHVDDMIWKMSLAAKARKGRRHKLALDDFEGPRYQIQVHLRGVPRRCIAFPDLVMPD